MCVETAIAFMAEAFAPAAAEAAFTGATATGLAAVAGETGASVAAATGLAEPAAAAASTSAFSMQNLSLLGQGASAVFGAMGKMQEASAAKNSAEYNAKVANMQAQDAIDRAQRDQEQLGRKIAATRGQQRANMAANGLDLSEGTPADVLAQTDYYGLEDQKTVADNGLREANMYQNRARLYSAQAEGYDPRITGATSLLAGGGQVADKWYQYYGKKAA